MSELRRKVIDMACEGLPPSVIAARTGAHPGTVSAYLYAARKSGIDVPRYRSGTAEIRDKWCFIAPDTVRRLAPAAALRGVTVQALAEALLSEAAYAGLVDAILDDEVTRDS